MTSLLGGLAHCVSMLIARFHSRIDVHVPSVLDPCSTARTGKVLHRIHSRVPRGRSPPSATRRALHRVVVQEFRRSRVTPPPNLVSRLVVAKSFWGKSHPHSQNQLVCSTPAQCAECELFSGRVSRPAKKPGEPKTDIGPNSSKRFPTLIWLFLEIISS